MKNKILPAFILIASLFACTTSRATLIGDTITISHQFPTLGSVLVVGFPGVPQSFDTIVEAGTGDLVTINTGGGPAYTVNPEATSVSVDFLRTINFATDAFNGLVVEGINDSITGASISTNVAGWADSLFVFDAHSFSANWTGLSVNSSSVFDVTLITDVSVPDAGSTAALFALSFLALAGVTRRFRI